MSFLYRLSISFPRCSRGCTRNFQCLMQIYPVLLPLFAFLISYRIPLKKIYIFFYSKDRFIKSVMSHPLWTNVIFYEIYQISNIEMVVIFILHLIIHLNMYRLFQHIGNSDWTSKFSFSNIQYIQNIIIPIEHFIKFIFYIISKIHFWFPIIRLSNEYNVIKKNIIAN